MTFAAFQRAIAPPELSASMTGSFTAIGTLLGPPLIIIFDNQGTVPVAISFDGGTTTWKTFSAGEALVLDEAAAGAVLSKGTIVSGNGASGTFSVSYIYTPFLG